ncbi:hypothetical protein T484DRAFT_1826400, partial [Baffinella frigidus]
KRPGVWGTAKVERYAAPWQQLKFQYGNAKGKAFTEEEDRFIVCMCHQLGYPPHPPL